MDVKKFGMVIKYEKWMMNRNKYMIRVSQYKFMQLGAYFVSTSKREDHIYAGWQIQARKDEEDDRKKPNKYSIAAKEDDMKILQKNAKETRTRQDTSNAAAYSMRQSEKCGLDVNIKIVNNNTATRVQSSEKDFISRNTAQLATMYEKYQRKPGKVHMWSEEVAIYVQTIVFCHIPDDCEIGRGDDAEAQKRKLKRLVTELKDLCEVSKRWRKKIRAEPRVTLKGQKSSHE